MRRYGVRVEGFDAGHDNYHEHHHDHDHGRRHGHRQVAEGAVEMIPRTQDGLAKYDWLAARNREWLPEYGMCAVKLMSSPGAGGTTLLERTVRELTAEMPVAVIEGDRRPDGGE